MISHGICQEKNPVLAKTIKYPRLDLSFHPHELDFRFPNSNLSLTLASADTSRQEWRRFRLHNKNIFQVPYAQERVAGEMIFFLREDLFLDRLERGQNQIFDFPEEGEEIVKAGVEETAWLKGMKRRVEEEMANKEIDTILYWKGEMEKILAKRPESLGTFQIEMQNFTQRMQNRIKVLKNSLAK
jgi:hypothetical protein